MWDRLRSKSYLLQMNFVKVWRRGRHSHQHLSAHSNIGDDVLAGDRLGCQLMFAGSQELVKERIMAEIEKLRVLPEPMEWLFWVFSMRELSIVPEKTMRTQ